MTFYFTASSATGVTGQFLDWTSMPSLTDPASKTVYQVNTYKQKDDSSSSADYLYQCVCSEVTDAGGPSDKVLYTAQYPALPASVTTVQLTDPRFKKVDIPVSR